MKDKMVVCGTEFPTKCEVDGMPAHRVEPGEYIDGYTVLNETFRGPFKAVDDSGNPIPGSFRSDLLKTDKGEKRVKVVLDSLHNPGGRVVDSDGKEVCKTPDWHTATMISISLNQQPKSIPEGVDLGLSWFHGLTKTAPDDDFSFWCIRVPVLYVGPKDGTEKPNRYSYVMPFYKRHQMPMPTRSPMSALRFSGHGSAQKVLDMIRNELIPQLSEAEKDFFVQHGNWKHDWDNAAPVQIKFAYNVIPLANKKNK